MNGQTIDVAAIYGEPYEIPEECKILTLDEALAVFGDIEG